MRLEVSSSSYHSQSSSPPPSHTTAHKMIALASASATPSVTQNTTNTKRPKLSLQTASLPIAFGKSSTGLARTCATASPTVRNTFNNAYETTRPLSTTDSPSPCRLSNNSKGPRYPSPFSHHYRTSDAAPYQQPLGVRSILQNSPLKKMSVRRQSMSMSAGALTENRRVLFPVKKQVTFHYQLEEEIRTVKFVARHSDLDSDSEPEPQAELESEGDTSSDSTGSHSDSHSSSGEDDGDIKNPLPQRKRRKSIPSERKIRAAALRDGLNEDHYAASLTTVSQTDRSKRRCKWRWTLGENTADSELESVPSVLPTDRLEKNDELATTTCL
ncbi:uncharacterized protein TRUGW13939_02786 [Talaromyces rugulosus]|uniref:Uncharacterized protein n=1 Tax=Talaromyces rugulosus TaxID=121627 RepID=A0A7H8QP99_TALRU|nr:uncharacterized protein TRUGW13939_02786 [Talaromyces rugulosus]QKX55689.1 hypothetical protein TRUGW13939_02786 [Talaromyces rugulosus]